VTQGKIADILMARGQLDEALRICQQEQLPVYERLGDVRSRAVTQGKIADILMARGQLDEALHLLQTELVPVFERLGDVRGLIVGRTNLAIALVLRGQKEDGQIALDLLLWAWTEARRRGYPEAGEIAVLLGQLGMPADMLDAFASRRPEA
jgi:hypothetical protein